MLGAGPPPGVILVNKGHAVAGAMSFRVHGPAEVRAGLVSVALVATEDFVDAQSLDGHLGAC